MGWGGGGGGVASNKNDIDHWCEALAVLHPGRYEDVYLKCATPFVKVSVASCVDEPIL